MDHRPSIAAEAAGNPGRQVLVARKAGAVVVAGEAAGETSGAPARRNSFGKRQRRECLTFEDLENEYVTSSPQNPFYNLVDASGADGRVCRLQ